MDRNEIIAKINTVLADEFEIDAAIITPDAPLSEGSVKLFPWGPKDF